MKILCSINNVYLGKCNPKIIIKTSDISKVKHVNKEIYINHNTDFDSAIKKIHCRFLSVDLNSLNTKIRC